MAVIKRVSATFFMSSFLVLVSATPAWAVVNLRTDGGDCASVGTWNGLTHTCTLTEDINETGATDSIVIRDDGITLDGNGHHLNGYDNHGIGVYLDGVAGATVKNLTVYDYLYGIGGFNTAAAGGGNLIVANNVYNNNVGIYLQSCGPDDIIANNVYSNHDGIYLSAMSANNEIRYNSVTSSFYDGLRIISSDNNLVVGNSVGSSGGYCAYVTGDNNDLYTNDFFSGYGLCAYDTGTGNDFYWGVGRGNYWSGYDSPAENCDNVAGFDAFCDDLLPIGGSSPAADNYAFTLEGGWKRFDFTWYDNVHGQNWILMANPSGATQDLWMDLKIDGLTQPLPALTGYANGQIPPGRSVTPTYSGQMGGPVEVYLRDHSSDPLVSQRTLWPVGGSSLEEVNGTDVYRLSDKFWWTWYDMQNPGFQNWILVSNPNSFAVDVYFSVPGGSEWVHDIAPGAQAIRTFPGIMTGPVSVQAFVDDTADPAKIMASQRVLTNSGTAFNEVPGVPDEELSSRYMWTWYDNVGGANWVLVANPWGDAATNIYYTIKIGNATTTCLGPVADDDTDTRRFTNVIGGPVEVRSYSNNSCTTPANSIASQRTLWGPSFEEVPGLPYGSLTTVNYWTWYDMQSSGASNWVLIANPANSPVWIYYEIKVGGTVIGTGGPIYPGNNLTPTFPGLMGGPVEVRTYSDAARTTPHIAIVSQRVLWNGYFNEVWGQ
ncbi:MAG: NosD domain-containing protein [Thermoleophilia bacterium]